MKIARSFDTKAIIDDGKRFVFIDTALTRISKVYKPCKKWPEFEGFKEEFMAMNDEDFSSLVSEMLEE